MRNCAKLVHCQAAAWEPGRAYKQTTPGFCSAHGYPRKKCETLLSMEVPQDVTPARSVGLCHLSWAACELRGPMSAGSRSGARGLLRRQIAKRARYPVRQIVRDQAGSDTTRRCTVQKSTKAGRR